MEFVNKEKLAVILHNEDNWRLVQALNGVFISLSFFSHMILWNFMEICYSNNDQSIQNLTEIIISD